MCKYGQASDCPVLLIGDKVFEYQGPNHARVSALDQQVCMSLMQPRPAFLLARKSSVEISNLSHGFVLFNYVHHIEKR